MNKTTKEHTEANGLKQFTMMLFFFRLRLDGLHDL